MTATLKIPFDNSYAHLTEGLGRRQSPVPVNNPRLIRVNTALAQLLGIEPATLQTPEGVEVLAGNRTPEGAEPLATVYAGHQFGHWNPQLGDGRAILLGEVVGRDGERYDIQLKGSGRTPYSRGGDGRSPLGPVLREYVLSEAMFALGIPTTRSLAAILTDDRILREEALPGGVLTRVARSHIRVGTFQFFASRRDDDTVKKLADHVIARHYSALTDSDTPYVDLLSAVIERQVKLVAQWMSIGFIHGVMNTDNMLVSGETIDYGPCAFMDDYHPKTVFSSIDSQGRYAYNNQPGIAQWNLARFAEAILPLLGDNEDAAVEAGNSALSRFAPQFEVALNGLMVNKIGFQAVDESTVGLVSELLRLMDENSLDFTLVFRTLADQLGEGNNPQSVQTIYPLPDALGDWTAKWRAALGERAIAAQTLMYRVNPVFIPRNHRVEQAIEAATYRGDLSLFHRLVDVLEKPFEFRVEDAEYALPPKPEEVVARTFCGT